jgi:anti-sigma B factor antagonist
MTDQHEFSVSTERGGDRIDVVVTGDVDSATSNQLETLLSDLADPAEVLHVAVDLAGVGFIDSSGLRALIVGQRVVEAAGSRLTIGMASAPVRRLFEMTGLVDRFFLP